jgi:hypothetical protein
MRGIAVLLTLFLVASASSFADCGVHVNDMEVTVQIRDYGTGEGYVTLPVKTLRLYDYMELYNHTRIYFAGYNSSGMCSDNCGTGYTNGFNAYLVMVGE